MAASSEGVAGSGGRLVWRDSPPELVTERIVLREVRREDAPALLAMFADPEVRRFVPPGPRTVDDFQRFIAWVRRERRAGRYMCFTVLGPDRNAAGLFQLWPVEPGFATAEWGFAVGRHLWGTGLFNHAAQLILDFAFGTLGVRRLECRAAARNGGALRALQRLGASREGTLREAFTTPEGPTDYVMHSILSREWRTRET